MTWYIKLLITKAFIYPCSIVYCVMSAVYPSDEPEDEENPNDIIDKIINELFGDVR